jgi:hypothetical protein
MFLLEKKTEYYMENNPIATVILLYSDLASIWVCYTYIYIADMLVPKDSVPMIAIT